MNCESLKKALDQVGVPSTAYSIRDDNLSEVIENGGYSLRFDKELKMWTVNKYENGTRKIVEGFHSEAGACDKLYYELTETNKNFSRLLENLPFEKTRGLKDPCVVRDLKDWLFSNAGATEPRLITSLLQLKALLLIKRVPFRAYSILGCNPWLDPNGGRSLKYDFETNSWFLWIYERGKKGLIYDTDSKTEACTVFYHLLADSLRKAFRTILVETSTITCETIKDLLVEKGIPRDWYSILGDIQPAEDMLLLEHNFREKTWELFSFEKGLKSLVCTLYSESAACEELLCILLHSQEECAKRATLNRR